VPTRVGFQCPFSNLTFDIKVPSTLKDEPALIGGKFMERTYGEFQEQMDLFNRAFCAVMLEGDAKGRVFNLSDPTINITKSFDWRTPSWTISCVSPANTAFRILRTTSIPIFRRGCGLHVLPASELINATA
jgi:anaerobic ribonucleoside-triphosphate reductase